MFMPKHNCILNYRWERQFELSYFALQAYTIFYPVCSFKFVSPKYRRCSCLWPLGLSILQGSNHFLLDLKPTTGNLIIPLVPCI